jgi:N-acetylglucosaminyldiphosphoundecaprenol N-acetyl-beta-D-mannosaminyltransferase
MSPPFRALTEEEDTTICAEINHLKPDIFLVGLGTPKQDYWIEDHLEKVRGSVFVASGATLDFFGGRIKMAPKWIRVSGFEWLYRLFSKDFNRLWKRYTYYNYIFLKYFFLQMCGVKKCNVERKFR